MGMLEGNYDPKSVDEARIYQWWNDSGFFKPEVHENGDPFCLVIPPPNVTSQLHVGHAIETVMMDATIRFNRMLGNRTLWVPGVDHASIATEVKVVEHLKKTEGRTKHDLGREKFLEKAWEWKDTYHKRITGQFQAMGASPDWTRERFMMDDDYLVSVRRAFKVYHEQGLIRRGTYLVNWSPALQTAVSDLEVTREKETGKLYYITYRGTGGAPDITVATVRPETMFGDVAVAVGPTDERFKNYLGQSVKIPISGKEIPIIGDDYVDAEFGTGALKITPASDPNDWEIGKRHNLPPVEIISKAGTLKDVDEVPEKYRGMEVLEARKAVMEDLVELGHIVKVEDYEHEPGRCQRSGCLVEPMISDQWFLDMSGLAERSIREVREAADKGEYAFIPERWHKVFDNWLENIRDWCISRQLWWGIRIPAWYCADCNEITVTDTEHCEKCSHCGSTQITQDEDVLDTWFSSALWPFAVLGWPHQTDSEDYKMFYPTTTMITGFDILFFWVARMVFSGLQFTDQLPFKDVVIHGLVMDEFGKKMSKSSPNAVDPLDVVSEHGADALRYALGTVATQEQHYGFNGPEKVRESRAFLNKLWNASKLVQMGIGEDFQPTPLKDIAPDSFDLADRWILKKLEAAQSEARSHMEGYRYSHALSAGRDFFWNDFCDWYLEYAKIPLDGDNASRKDAVKNVLLHVLEGCLRMLHPFVPFVTEHIYQQLPGHAETIMVGPFGLCAEVDFDQAVIVHFETLQNAIRAIRNMRRELNLGPRERVRVVLRCQNGGLKELFESQSGLISNQKFGGLEALEIIGADDKAPGRCLYTAFEEFEAFLPISDEEKLKAEIARQEKELAKAQKAQQQVERKLSSEKFVNGAPAEVVAREREKAAENQAIIDKVSERLQMLAS